MTEFLIQSPAGNTVDSLPSVNVGSSANGALASNPWSATHTFHELVASTSESWAGFYSVFWEINNNGIMHFAKGSSGNEKIFASVFNIAGNRSFTTYIPIPIPAGTRISAALTSKFSYNFAAGTIEAVPARNFKSLPNFIRMDVGPFNLTANTTDYLTGTVVDAGGTANTKSAWTEISQTSHSGNILQGDSLPYRYKYLGWRCDLADFGTTAESPNFLVDLAYGASGSEVAFIENHPMKIKSYSSTAVPHNDIRWIPWNRPAGDRISARIQCDNITVGERELQFWLYGLR